MIDPNSIISFLPATHATEKPFAIALPKLEISGDILYIYCAPFKCHLKPVIISSNIKTILFSLHSSSTSFKKCLLEKYFLEHCDFIQQPVMELISGQTFVAGSKTKQEIPLDLNFFIIFFKPSISLYLKLIVKLLMSFGIPLFIIVEPMNQSS